ncbi:MAG: hypothetical protein ABS36_11940 [Acidobacteria bacterium SCN 69-37]|mgnify:CR=1 FL=1|nr:MAG: hypothetical protein ABS36_11940 [Acidobacteria bacterium SCN 69-37]
MTLEIARGHLEATPSVLRALTTTLSAEVLSYREAPEHWTVFEVLCHLTDTEEHNWLPRLRVFFEADDDRRFRPMDRERGRQRYAEWSVDALLDAFAQRRAENLTALDDLRLTSADLERQAQHPQLGVVTAAQLLATWATHDHAHVAQISRVLVRCHGDAVGPWRAFFSLLRSDGTP